MDQMESPPPGENELMSPLQHALQRPVPDDLLTAAEKLKSARERYANSQVAFSVFGSPKSIRETKNAIAAAERALEKLEQLSNKTFIDQHALQQEITLAKTAVAEAKAEDTLRAELARTRADGIVRARKNLVDAIGVHRAALQEWLKPVLKAADGQAAAAYAMLMEAQAFQQRVALPYDNRPLRLARRIVGSGDYNAHAPSMPEWLGAAAREWQAGYRALIAR